MKNSIYISIWVLILIWGFSLIFFNHFVIDTFSSSSFNSNNLATDLLRVTMIIFISSEFKREKRVNLYYDYFDHYVGLLLISLASFEIRKLYTVRELIELGLVRKWRSRFKDYIYHSHYLSWSEWKLYSSKEGRCSCSI